jgi:hypothetical protein
MKRLVSGILGVLALSATTLLAQGRDFSGTWTVDAERTAAANPGGVGGFGGGGGAVIATRGGGGGGGGGGAVMAGGGGGGRAMVRSAEGMSTSTVQTTIAMDATSFTVTTGSDVTVYKFDGSETPVGRRGNAVAKAAWKGDRLVIETTTQLPSGPITQTTTWYLEGTSLVSEVSTPTQSGQPTVRKTYYTQR